MCVKLTVFVCEGGTWQRNRAFSPRAEDDVSKALLINPPSLLEVVVPSSAAKFAVVGWADAVELVTFSWPKKETQKQPSLLNKWN